MLNKRFFYILIPLVFISFIVVSRFVVYANQGCDGCCHMCRNGRDCCDGDDSDGSPPPPPPPTAPIMGVVWYDFNENGGYEVGESWGKTACTRWVSSTMNINYSSTNANWGCQPGPMAYYAGAAVVVGTNQTVTLTTPNGYDCSWVTWSYTKCGNSGCTSGNSTGSGSGCTATIPSISLYGNHLWWRIAPVYRTLSGRLYESTGGIRCIDTGRVLSIPNLQAVSYNSSGGVVATIPVNPARGTFSSRVYNTLAFSTLCINGTIMSGNKVYTLRCTGATGATTTRTSNACIRYSPTNALLTSDVSISLGFNVYDAKQWFTSLNGDIFGSNIIAYVATAPQVGSGFKGNIIIDTTAASTGGYGFSGTTINTQTVGTSISSKGGGAQQASVKNSIFGRDTWLSSFAFIAPVTALPRPASLAAGGVYKMTAAQLKAILDTGSFSLNGRTAGQPNIAIVYVEDAATPVTFTTSFTSVNPEDMLVIVSAAPVNIPANLTVPALGTYTTTSTPQIAAVIISKSTLAINSSYNDRVDPPVYDMPIYITGILAGKSQLLLSRSLGGLNNGLYPAETVNYYGGVLPKIVDYEMSHRTAAGYTGLATFDTQWSALE